MIVLIISPNFWFLYSIQTKENSLALLFEFVINFEFHTGLITKKDSLAKAKLGECGF